MFLEFYLFYVLGERVIGWVCEREGRGRNISSPLRGGIKNFPMHFGECQILW